MFQNREEAARQLAIKLQDYEGKKGVVLAIPRGGVPIGYVIAEYLGMPLDIALSKKIGYPGNPEYAIGSVSLHGRVINKNIAVSEEYINSETERIRLALKERYRKYVGNREPLELKNKTVIIVDDGIATGHTMLATIDMVRAQNPLKIVVAAPVAAPATERKLKEQADAVVCLITPVDFYGVGQFYEDFQQVDDSTVIHYLEVANNRVES